MLENRQIESIMWKTGDVSTSAYPCQRWRTKVVHGETAATTTSRQLRECLELPGSVSAYHFIIQQGHVDLWSFRLTEPWVVNEVEKLCKLDISLVMAHPEPFQLNDQGFVYITAFERLIKLYEREGYLDEALEIAQKAAKLGNQQAALNSIQEKIAILKREEIA